MADAWAWLIVGGGVLVTGALLVRSAKATTPAPTATADACDRLAPLGSDAVALCKASKVASAVVKTVVAPLRAADSKNQDINGAAVEFLDPAIRGVLAVNVRESYSGSLASSNVQYLPTKAPHTIRYANGCVPYKGSPEWSKCAAGTKAMNDADDGRQSYWGSVDAAHRKSGPDAMMSGDPARDVLTFRWPENTKVPFPLPVPAGATAWVYRGRPMVCPVGTEVRGRDLSPGAQPCVATYGTGPGQAPLPVPPPPATTTRSGAGGDYRSDPAR